MRVAMIGWEFPPFKAGGLGVHCYELTGELTKLGIEVDFYMPETGMDIKPHSPGLRIHQVKAAPGIGPYDSPPSDFYTAVKEYNRNVVDAVLERDFDLIHAHDWLTYMAAVELKKRTGKPMVITVHSTEWDRTGGNPSEWIYGIEKAGMDHADIVITVSYRMKKNLSIIYGIDPDKVWVVYNGVNAEKLKAKRERGLWGKKVILYLGRLTIQKNPEAFLLAAKRVLDLRKDVHFIICGTGDMMGYLIDRSIELGISENVTFTGFVSDEEATWLYSIANAYVLPAISEPFGITVLEAMGSGVPVIISKQVGVGEVLHHCLKVDFWDADDMAQKILSVVEFTPLVEELSARAVEEARGFTWEKTARATLEVYRAAMLPPWERPKPPKPPVIPEEPLPAPVDEEEIPPPVYGTKKTGRVSKKQLKMEAPAGVEEDTDKEEKKGGQGRKGGAKAGGKKSGGRGKAKKGSEGRKTKKAPKKSRSKKG